MQLGKKSSKEETYSDLHQQSSSLGAMLTDLSVRRKNVCVGFGLGKNPNVFCYFTVSKNI